MKYKNKARIDKSDIKYWCFCDYSSVLFFLSWVELDIADKIFENEGDIDEFMAYVFTLIVILSVATEIKCNSVTWITMNY